MRKPNLREVEDLVKGLPGVVEAQPLEEDLRRRALEVEEAYESSSVLPVRNLGVHAALARDSTLVLLKDSTFRQPGSPSVYMVEEGDSLPEAQVCLEVAGRRYRIIGEEVPASCARTGERSIPISDTFLLYPGRRSGGDVPCYFILPPLGFPELEGRAAELGICNIVSISPSLALDEFVRRALGFPATNALATILVGFDHAAPQA